MQRKFLFLCLIIICFFPLYSCDKLSKQKEESINNIASFCLECEKENYEYSMIFINLEKEEAIKEINLEKDVTRIKEIEILCLTKIKEFILNSDEVENIKNTFENEYKKRHIYYSDYRNNINYFLGKINDAYILIMNYDLDNSYAREYFIDDYPFYFIPEQICVIKDDKYYRLCDYIQLRKEDISIIHERFKQIIWKEHPEV